MAGLRLQGAPNFRDLGGMPTADGRRIKPGLVYRSCALDQLTPEDVDALGAVGVELICDLRTAKERESRPNRPLSPEPQVMLAHAEAEADAPDLKEAFAQVQGSPRQILQDYVDNMYSTLPQVTASTIRELVDRILDGQLPVVVHCTGGKDRTAWTIVVLQLALRVPEEKIFEDYLLTDRYYGAPELHALMLDWFGREPDPLMVDMFRVEPERLRLALRSTGPVDEFLEREIGLSPERRAELIELLTEPA